MVFRHKVFKMLLSKGKITDDLVRMLMSHFSMAVIWMGECGITLAFFKSSLLYKECQRVARIWKKPKRTACISCKEKEPASGDKNHVCF